MVKRIKIKKSEAASRLVGGSLRPADSGAFMKEPSRSPLHSLAATANAQDPTASATQPPTAKPTTASIRHEETQPLTESTVLDAVSHHSVRPKKRVSVSQNRLQNSQSAPMSESQARKDPRVPMDTEPKNTHVSEENPIVIDIDDAENDSPVECSPVKTDDTKQSSEFRDGALTSVPLLSQKIKQCWVCSVQLEFPDDEVAYYMKYAHPLFPASEELSSSCNETEGRNDSSTSAPMFVCSECAPALVENDAECSKSDNDATDDTCALCLEEDHEEALFLCDGCPRQVCQVCVACCNGGGAKGAQHTNEVAKLDKSWMCPICKPPNDLMEMAKSQPFLPNPRRSLEDLLMLLTEVERMKKEAEITLENSDEDSQSDEWKSEWEAHDRRLLDTISHIQEELETVHDVDLSEVYHKEFKKEKPAVPSQVEAWVEAADKEVQQRYDDMPQKEWGRFRDQFTDVIEDLETEESETTKPKAQGWSSTQPCAHPEDIEDAIANENAIFKTKRINLVRVSEKADKIKSLAKANTRTYLDDFTKPKRNRRKNVDNSSNNDNRKNQKHQECTTGETTDDVSSQPNSSLTKDSRVLEQVLPRPAPSPSINDGPKDSSTAKQKRQRSSTNIEASLDVSPEPGLTVSDRPTIQEFAPTKGIAEILKPHQLEGLMFMGQNCFGDCVFDGGKVSGALLAHNMGLGKSLQAIALVHTVLVRNLGRSRSEGKPRILICVPVNTMLNWLHEFEKWQYAMIPRLDLPLSLSDAINKRAKQTMTNRWVLRGGVMLCTHGQLGACEDLKKADLVINDEAHVTLKNPKTNMYKHLSRFETKRRVGLSGTPIQNNLLEYYHMMTWLQPGLLPDNPRYFERDFIEPINAGLVSDCTSAEHQRSLDKTKELHQILDPYVQRKSASLLAESLPPIQQSVLYLQQSKLQSRLFSGLKRFQKQQMNNSFFVSFSALRPINNAPGALPLRLNSRKEGDKDSESVVKWWESVIRKYGNDELSRVEHSHKIIILLHILVMATEMGDKTIVFSQSLSTLDYVESILKKDWTDLCPSLSDLIRKTNFGRGRWQKDHDYLRIDGSVTADERGDRIQEFEKDGSAFKLFLLSTVAGGVGINLVAANRVVLLDTHFNPSLSEQAIFRSYRYGQTKPTFVYRLLIENSIEEKIYARTVTKTGLALRVIDKKTIEKHFSRREIEDLNNTLDWIRCDKCDKWRVIDRDSMAEEPEHWFCSMNHDPRHNKCSDPERSQAWYESDLRNDVDVVAGCEASPSISEEAQKKLEANDSILQHLLTLSQGQTKRKIVSNSKFHNFLVASKGEDEDSQRDSEAEKSVPRSPGSRKQSSCEGKGNVSPLRKELQAFSPKRPNSSKRKVVHSPSASNRKKASNASENIQKPLTPIGSSTTEEVIHIDDFEDEGDQNQNQAPDSRRNESMASASSSRYSRRRRKAADQYEPKEDKQKRSTLESKGKRQKVTASKDRRPPAVKGKIINLCDSDSD